MKFSKVRSHFHVAGPVYEQTFVFAISLLVFSCAIVAVFYGFIGYYSRVVLISEFQKEGKGANIDYIFMEIDQIERDEANLNMRRANIVDLQQKIYSETSKLKSAAIASKEYEEYVTSSMAIVDRIYGARDILTDDYWGKIGRIDYSQPDLSQAELFGNPVYKEGVATEQQVELYRQLGSIIQNFRYKIVYYSTRYGNLIGQVGSLEKAEIESSRAIIRQALTRNPVLALREEIEAYGLQKLMTDPNQEQLIGQHRAILGSYRRALGSASIILQWPTIVSTMVVTMATGLLGGVVSFMGSSIRSRRAETTVQAAIRSEILALVRRSVFGVMAALAIFLLAGSGLLVLTAQSGKLVSPGSIELSPYFVAFLAFISGFLADEAFERITKAGRAIFQTSDAPHGGTR